MIVHHTILIGLLVGFTGLASVLSILNVRHGEREISLNQDWLSEHLGIDDTGELVDYLRASTGLSLL